MSSVAGIDVAVWGAPHARRVQQPCRRLSFRFPCVKVATRRGKRITPLPPETTGPGGTTGARNASKPPRFGSEINRFLCLLLGRRDATNLGDFLLLRALALQEGLEGDGLPLSHYEQAALLHVHALPADLCDCQPQRGHEREKPRSQGRSRL